MARIKEAIAWIAFNDNAGDDHAGNSEAEYNVSGYVSTLLVADVWGKTPQYVAAAVMKIRRDDAFRRRRNETGCARIMT